jgi:carbamoyl-phosphate synthase large subunit
MKPRVLLTGAGGPAGRALAAQLKSRGIPVLGTDIRELPAGAGITVVPVPAATDPELVSALRRLVIREGINLVIPTVTRNFLLAAYRAAFGTGVPSPSANRPRRSPATSLHH